VSSELFVPEWRRSFSASYGQGEKTAQPQVEVVPTPQAEPEKEMPVTKKSDE